jgi:hypothetical protein
MTNQGPTSKAWVSAYSGVMLLLGVATGRSESTNLLSLAQVVPPSSLTGSGLVDSTPRLKPSFLPAELRIQTVPLQTRRSDSQRRWLKFEADFGARTEDPSSILGAIESAKHILDWTSQELRDWAETVKENISFDIELRNLTRATPATTPPRPIRDNFLLDFWENARFQSDISFHKSSRAFVGVKLTLPIGD